MGDSSNLPPGFRFYPSDEELVVHFLQRRATLLPCHPDVIPDLDLFPYDPWDLHGKALSEGRKWYYYSRRTQHRVSPSGHWKAMGVDDEPIFSSTNGRKVGTKKYFMFYMGEPEHGSWTNWIMHEYRLSDASSSSASSSRKSRSRPNDHSRWVICKVFEETEDDDDDDNDGTELSCLDEVFLSMDDYDEISLPS